VWLESFGFPGNVRQLENICHWLTVMAPAQVIEPKDLPPEVGVSRLSERPVVQVPTHAAPQSAIDPVADAGGMPSVLADPIFPLPHILATVAEGGWEANLDAEAEVLLGTGRTDVWDELTRRFESRLILAALASTKGRRIEAAHKLGIGRNTITRKIQELGLE